MAQLDGGAIHMWGLQPTARSSDLWFLRIEILYNWEGRESLSCKKERNVNIFEPTPHWLAWQRPFPPSLINALFNVKIFFMRQRNSRNALSKAGGSPFLEEPQRPDFRWVDVDSASALSVWLPSAIDAAHLSRRFAWPASPLQLPPWIVP